jgi:hypothetical protein
VLQKLHFMTHTTFRCTWVCNNMARDQQGEDDPIITLGSQNDGD